MGKFSYPKQQQIERYQNFQESIFDQIDRKDMLICTPYESFDPILRFFNEAAIDPAVEEIYTTLYRIASDSRIAQALATADEKWKKSQCICRIESTF